MQYIYIKIVKYILSLRLLCEHNENIAWLIILVMTFNLHSWRYYLNDLTWSQNVLTLLNEVIAHLVNGKCNPFMVDGGIVCNMA